MQFSEEIVYIARNYNRDKTILDDKMITIDSEFILDIKGKNKVTYRNAKDTISE